jgi:predicted Holliday junction resolvase-like endonuclease
MPMETLIAINIVVIFVNIVLILYLFIEIKKMKHNFKAKFEAIEENFDGRISELSNAVKFLTKINLKNMKKEENSKTVPFKPEDLEKIKEVLNVPN